MVLRNNLFTLSFLIRHLNFLTPKTNFMVTPRIVCGFSSMKQDNLLAKSSVILAGMADNLSFVSPTPTLDVIETLLSNYQVSCTAVKSGDRTQVKLRNQRKGLLAQGLTQLGTYVMLTTTDAAVLESSGFTLVKTPTATPPISAPTGLVATDAVNSGSMFISVDGQKNVKSYLFQYSIGLPTTEAGWSTATATKRSITITGLTVNTVYAIRVTAIGSRQQAAQSTVIYWTVR
jgi:hypothetical protein